MSVSKIKWLLPLIIFCHLHVVAQNKTCDVLIKKSRIEIDKKDFIKALEILSEAKTVAEKEGTPADVFCALNGMGECYYNMLDYGEALRFALEAYQIAEKSLGHVQQNKSLNNIGLLYTQEGNYFKAKQYLNKAYTATKEQNNFLETGHTCMNLGAIALHEDSIAKARTYYHEAKKYFKDKPKLLMHANIGLIETDLLLGYASVARAKATALYEEAKKIPGDFAERILLIIAKSYFDDKRYDEAVNNALKVLEMSSNPGLNQEIFQLLTSIYINKGDYKTAYIYKDSLQIAEKKLSELNNGKLFERTKAKFELANFKNEIALRDERAAAERKIYLSLLGVFIAAVVIVILVLRQKKVNAERNGKMAELELEKRESQHLLLEKQMRENEMAARLEKERLSNEIESRNRKLSAKALYLSGRNELIEQVINSLTQIPGVNSRTEISDYIKNLRGYLRTDAEWDDFIAYFEQVNPNFLKSLQEKHPALTFPDIRFICYIYMNLDLKEISTILNITIEACKKRKQRIAKKMEIEADDMQSYLLNINL